MADWRKRAIWLLQYAALRLVETAVQCFPIDANLGTARLVGDLLYRLDARHRRRAIKNLKASFPGLSDAAARRIARRSCRHLVMVGVEVLCMPRLMHFNSFFRYADISGCLQSLPYIAGDRPCLLVSGHFGNWEMVGYALAALGLPPTSVARPLDNPYLNAYIQALRARSGQKILMKFGVTEEAMAELDAGRNLGFIADQDAGRRGFFVDFFGRKASAYKSIAYLAMEKNLPILVGGACRVGDRFRYRLVMTGAVHPKDYPEGVDGALAITQAYTAAIERLVRHAPDQYLWVHRRWKTRPPEERKRRRAMGLPEKDKD
jgi:KDO2-lipid IV(A) lauroyltransferase